MQTAPRICLRSLEEANERAKRGAAAFHRGEIVVAIRELEHCCAALSELPILRGFSTALNLLGEAYYLHGDLDRAEIAYREALGRAAIEARSAGMRPLGNLGYVACDRGRFADAAALFQRAREVAIKEGNASYQAECERMIQNLAALKKAKLV